MARRKHDDRHFARERAKRAESFETMDPRWSRALRLERKNLLTAERRPNRPLLHRFADQLENPE